MTKKELEAKVKQLEELNAQLTKALCELPGILKDTIITYPVTYPVYPQYIPYIPPIYPSYDTPIITCLDVNPNYS